MYVVNLICMTLVLVSSSFGYYLIGYDLKYIRGNLYINGIVSSTSECFAYLFAGKVYERIGLKYTLIISYTIGIAGMLSLILTTTDNQYWLSLFVLGSKFGVSASFNIAFIGIYYLFPTDIVATAFGISNTVSRVATIFAPYAAELKPEYKG